MKLIDMVYVMLVLSMLFSAVLRFGKTFVDLDVREREVDLQKDSLTFISESFIKTCHGSGFSSLQEWQKVCGAMWKLDYIAWGGADSFLPLAENKLMYGVWRNSQIKGEIYSEAGQAVLEN